jgi:hypothetical protein
MHGTIGLRDSASVVVPHIPATPTMPVFEPRWWRSKTRLDIRPVLWSLRNRPEEWTQTEYTIMHVPSQHEFWTANGFFSYSLYRAGGCSCTRARGGGFSLLQKFEFSAALSKWTYWDRSRQAAAATGVNVQFAAHFLTPPKVGC